MCSFCVYTYEVFWDTYVNFVLQQYGMVKSDIHQFICNIFLHSSFLDIDILRNVYFKNV